MEELKCVGLNQDHTCITVGTSVGIRVFNTYPLLHFYSRDFAASFSIVTLLYRSNLVFLVGSEASTVFPASKLAVWDDSLQSFISEIVFSETISALRVRRDLFAVVMLNKIFVYSTYECILRDTLETCENPKGLCCMNADSENIILAYPGPEKGKVGLKVYFDEVKVINAFDSSIACMELNNDGSILACASDKGTLIRLFATDSQELLFELRRGIDKASIYSIAFHPTSEWIACSSDKGTIHIYSTGARAKNTKSNLAFMKKVLPKYFESEWSYAKFKLKNKKARCCFAKDNATLILLTENGEYHSINYSEPGECKHIEKYNLIDFNF